MVKIYKMDSSVIHDAQPNDGYVIDMVRASDYAELERQRDALVAENAELIKFIKRDCWIIDPDCDDYFDAAGYIPESPQTDAVLREIGAKAVEMLANHMRTNGYEHEACGAEVFAQQLREGKA